MTVNSASHAERRAIKRRFMGITAIFLLVTTLLLAFLVSTFERSRFFEVSDELERQSDQALRAFEASLAAEAQRPFAEYSLSNIPGIGLQNFLKISSLSRLNPDTKLPGLVGYFQVDANRVFETPLLPLNSSEGLENGDERLRRSRELFRILATGKSLEANTKTFRTSFRDLRADFDTGALQLATVKVAAKGELSKLDLKKGFSKSLPLSKYSKEAPTESVAQARVTSLAREANSSPFQAALLESGHLVFFRSVLIGKSRLLQGFVVEQKVFFRELFANVVVTGVPTNAIRLSLALGDTVLDLLEAPLPQSVILRQESLPEPLARLQYLFSAAELGFGGAQKLTLLACLATLAVMLIGLGVLYRASLRQLDLYDARSNFVSAVSHELRTPLTAIRMHGEMLVNGWVGSDGDRTTAYKFILTESERLSRLIENVLRFSRIERNADRLRIETLRACELSESATTRILPLAAAAGFTVEIKKSDVDSHTRCLVDLDAFHQVVLNLTDNALKFSKHSETKKIVWGMREVPTGIEFYLRDFGPGVPAHLGQQAFTLFARGEDELTRSSSGTGIGLALASRMMAAMGGAISYENRHPGCEFKFSLPKG